ncbi:MAG: helix-turn-helix transcriptional regulator [Desulfovibrio sp.]|uniref:helix-turn-helix domain-containing protein n=1 Tax=Desulfovibrio sp. TaxID=885 RepID=UPI0039E4F3A4
MTVRQALADMRFTWIGLGLCLSFGWLWSTSFRSALQQPTLSDWAIAAEPLGLAVGTGCLFWACAFYMLSGNTSRPTQIKIAVLAHLSPIIILGLPLFIARFSFTAYVIMAGFFAAAAGVWWMTQLLYLPPVSAVLAVTCSTIFSYLLATILPFLPIFSPNITACFLVGCLAVALLLALFVCKPFSGLSPSVEASELTPITAATIFAPILVPPGLAFGGIGFLSVLLAADTSGKDAALQLLGLIAAIILIASHQKYYANHSSHKSGLFLRYGALAICLIFLTGGILPSASERAITLLPVIGFMEAMALAVCTTALLQLRLPLPLMYLFSGLFLLMALSAVNFCHLAGWKIVYLTIDGAPVLLSLMAAVCTAALLYRLPTSPTPVAHSAKATIAAGAIIPTIINAAPENLPSNSAQLSDTLTMADITTLKSEARVESGSRKKQSKPKDEAMPPALGQEHHPETQNRKTGKATPDLLTARERGLALLLVNGHSNNEIAESLGLKRDTVRWYIKNLNKKMGTSDRQDLIAFLVKTKNTE